VFQNAIHNHIRLFEPLVIKALKQYTTSTSVGLQRQVLDLLSQLVQLRVNYCLLDSDQASHFDLWIKLLMGQHAIFYFSPLIESQNKSWYYFIFILYLHSSYMLLRCVCFRCSLVSF